MRELPDIGVVLLNLDNSPVYSLILKNLSTMASKLPYSQVVVFSSSCTIADTQHVPVLHISHAKFFRGILIHIDVSGLIISQNFPNLTDRYLFAFDTPWVGQEVGYKQWKSLFIDSNLKIISANVSIDNIYNLCWKEPSGIAEDFNHERILDIIEKTKS